MVDFVAESHRNELDKQFKAIQQQRLAQTKALEKLSISTNFSVATLKIVAHKKSTAKKIARQSAKTVSEQLNQPLTEMPIYIKGKTVSKMKVAYSDENQRLLKL
ncbi:hypothetical protein [Latilactobacillus fuchuensis]|uniref:hypothetical protein n=1 Tax=Latilactobacillus fuchuensis TaxID=164393 RepID=UPI0020C818ED|nr:hypothetical protein [Latilactobacillus fuchuensis]MCP8858317.1 hypothetical protein [Latilactobacillus fuchuensis]